MLTRAPATRKEYRTGFEDTASLAKTLIVELDGEVIGDLLLQIEDGWAQAEVAEQARGVHAELGWVLHPDHAGHGYATEAGGRCSSDRSESHPPIREGATTTLAMATVARNRCRGTSSSSLPSFSSK